MLENYLPIAVFWLYLVVRKSITTRAVAIAIILLIGFELNASIRQSKAQKSTYRIVE